MLFTQSSSHAPIGFKRFLAIFTLIWIAFFIVVSSASWIGRFFQIGRGHEIAVVGHGEAFNYDIYLLDWNRGLQHRLTWTNHIDDNPIWSPNGRYLAFYSSQSAFNHLYILDSENWQMVGPIASRQSEAMHAWSPDSRYLAYVRFSNGDLDIYSMDLETGDTTNLTDTPNIQELYPVWSPDGYWIAFSSNRHTSHDIYIMDSTGNGVRQLTFSETNDMMPAWSNDGQHIGYYAVDMTRTNSTIYIINRNGTEQRLLVDSLSINTNNRNNGLYWSQDDQHIAFVADDGDNLQVYVVDINSGSLQQLTTNPAPGSLAAPVFYHGAPILWLDDGEHIAYLSHASGIASPNFYVRHINGEVPVLVSSERFIGGLSSRP